MVVKWNKRAIQQLLDAIRFIEDNHFVAYAEELEQQILNRIDKLPENPTAHPVDKYRRNNDGTYRAFEVDQYRISYRSLPREVRIVRVRHTSRKPIKY